MTAPEVSTAGVAGVTAEPVWRAVAPGIEVSFTPGHACVPPSQAAIGACLVKVGSGAGIDAPARLDGATLAALAFADVLPAPVVWAALHLARCRAGVGERPYAQVLAGAHGAAARERLAWLFEAHGHLYVRDGVLSTRDVLVLRRVADSHCVELVAQTAGMRAQRVRLAQYDGDGCEFFALDGQF